MLSVKMQDRCISILVISLMLSYLAAGRLQDVCYHGSLLSLACHFCSIVIFSCENLHHSCCADT